jgi:hypothetical protein
MTVNSEERLIYFRKYHKDRRAEEPDLYKERGKLYAQTFRNKKKQEKIDKLTKTNPPPSPPLHEVAEGC